MILTIISKCEIRRYMDIFCFYILNSQIGISLNHLIHNLGIGDLALEMKSNLGRGGATIDLNIGY